MPQYRRSNVEELRQVELAIVRAVQEKSFSKEIQLLRNFKEKSSTDRNHVRQRKTVMKKTSSLFRLDPFLDNEGILRVGGRLNRSGIPLHVKHPAILLRKRATRKWFLDSRRTLCHRRYISDCLPCRKLRASPQDQKMADLPQDRLEPSPPFTFCGVDYFGPWHITEGRREMKRYRVVFTCFADLEVSKTLDTDSFINVLRCFLARRGPVRILRSDQGTNLMGARNELFEAMKEMNKDKVREFLVEKECDWIQFQMNVPAASHMAEFGNVK